MIVYADASKLSVSCIIMQSGDSDTEPRYVIAYGSRKLLPRERNFAIVELELLSIVQAMQKFHHLLYGRKIQVFTDHRPLSWLASLSKHNPGLPDGHYSYKNMTFQRITFREEIRWQTV